MARPVISDVFKVFLYVAASLLLGALMAPWIYNVGMGLAEITANKQTNGFLEWLGDAARRSADNFPRFFDRATLLAGLLLLGPLLAWLKLGREHERYRDTPWSLRLPDHVISDRGQPLEKNANGWMHLFAGFGIAAGLLVISGLLMTWAGFFVWRDAPASTQGFINPQIEAIDWIRALRKAAPAAVVVALVEELLFRGILLGIFLRALRPTVAIIAVSFLFAFVHFLDPPVGTVISDPEASDAGFILLGQIISHFTDPFSLLSRFMVIFMVGITLGVARFRTASIWLPIGLHAGWVFSFAMFKAATWSVPGPTGLARWLVGNNLMEGLLPLSMVALTAVVVARFTRPRPVEPLLDE